MATQQHGGKWLFRLIMAGLILLALAGIYDAATTSEPWPGEMQVSIGGLAFFAVLWGGVERAAKARGKW